MALAMLLALGSGALLAPAVHAQVADSPALHRHCLSTGTLDEDFLASLANRSWQCGEAGHSIVPERSILRFDLADAAGEAPMRHFVTRRSPMLQLHVAVEDSNGSIRSQSFTYEEVRPAPGGDLFTLPLPAVTPQSRFVHVAIDGPTHVMTLQRAHVSPGDPASDPSNQRLLMLLSVLCGMLLMPLVFNAGFYRVLREKFVLWHAFLALSLLLTVFFNGGLSLFVFDMSPAMLSSWSIIALGFSVAAGAMFAHSFVEPGRLHPLLRKALPWMALWSIAISVLHANFPFVGRSWQADAYYLGYLPVLAILIVVMIDALQRGSRAAKFQAVGWAPLLLVGAMRIVGQLTPAIAPTDAMTLFYIGCVFEVIATTLGVADRFMIIKKQRDRARSEAILLEQMSERDTLTGLFNRRFLAERFDRLRTEGYTTLAVLDLDHFKSINDSYGHSKGDEVLRAVAVALEPDADTIAVRLGGEEFALLIRGRGAIERAEHCRQQLTRIVAETVDIDRKVTSSMGVVDAPAEALPHAGFGMLYERADRLLYEAKQAGRDRTFSERLKLFRPREIRDRRAAA